MSKKNNIEDLFRQKMGNAEVTPPADVKRAIDKALNFPSSNLRYLKYVLLLFIIIGTGAAAFYLGANADSKNELSVNEKTSKNSTSFPTTEAKPSTLEKFSSSTEVQPQHSEISPNARQNSSDTLSMNAEKSKFSATTSTSTGLSAQNSNPTKNSSSSATKTGGSSKNSNGINSSSKTNTAPSSSSKNNEEPNKNTASQNEVNTTSTSGSNPSQKNENGSVNQASSSDSTSTNSNTSANEASKSVNVNGNANSVSTTATSTADSLAQVSDSSDNGQEVATTKNEAEENKPEGKKKPSKIIEGYSIGIDLSLPKFNTSQEIQGIPSTPIQPSSDVYSYNSVLMYELYGQIKAFNGFHGQIGGQYQHATSTFTSDSSYTTFTSYDSIVYTYDSGGQVIIDSTIYTNYDSTTVVKNIELQNAFNYYNIPISVGRTFVLNPNGNGQLILMTNLGADLRFTRVTGDLPSDLTVNPFTMNFTLRNTLAYEIGDFYIMLPIQVNYAPKSRLMYQETRIDPKSSLGIGLGIQYNF